MTTANTAALTAPIRSPGLMYNTAEGDRFATYQELRAVPTPAPMGPHHLPVGFGAFMELVKHRLDRAGIEIGIEEYAITKSGQAFFGAMTVGVDGFSVDGLQFVIGVRGSHDQTVPRGLCVGTQTMVCSNLCFSGSHGTFQTKQTTNVWDRLPGFVEQAVAALPGAAAREAQRHDQYRLTQLRPRWGDAALVEMARRDALTPAQLGRAIHEWDEPTYEAHAEDGFTAWRLLNAVTEAQKPTGQTVNMQTVAERTARAVSFLDEVAGL